MVAVSQVPSPESSAKSLLPLIDNVGQYPLVGGCESCLDSDSLGDCHGAQGKKEDQDYQGHLREIEGIHP